MACFTGWYVLRGSCAGDHRLDFPGAPWNRSTCVVYYASKCVLSSVWARGKVRILLSVHLMQPWRVADYVILRLIEILCPLLKAFQCLFAESFKFLESWLNMKAKSGLVEPTRYRSIFTPEQYGCVFVSIGALYICKSSILTPLSYTGFTGVHCSVSRSSVISSVSLGCDMWTIRPLAFSVNDYPSICFGTPMSLVLYFCGGLSVASCTFLCSRRPLWSYR